MVNTQRQARLILLLSLPSLFIASSSSHPGIYVIPQSLLRPRYNYAHARARIGLSQPRRREKKAEGKRVKLASLTGAKRERERRRTYVQLTRRVSGRTEITSKAVCAARAFARTDEKEARAAMCVYMRVTRARELGSYPGHPFPDVERGGGGTRADIYTRLCGEQKQKETRAARV